MSGGQADDLAAHGPARVADASPTLDRVKADQGEEVRPLPTVGFWRWLFGVRETAAPIARNYTLEQFNLINRQWQERRDRAISLGFRLAYDPLTMLYTEGFDPHAEYQFLAPSWETPQVFKLSSVSPYFNISGLLYREMPS